MVLFIRKSYKRLHTILSRGQVLSVWIEMGLAPGGGNFPEKTLGRMAVSDTSGRVSPACLVSRSPHLCTQETSSLQCSCTSVLYEPEPSYEMVKGEVRHIGTGPLCKCSVKVSCAHAEETVHSKTPRLLVFLPVSLSRQKNKLLLSYQSTNQGG